MKDDSGKISYSPDGAVWANVHFGQLDSSTPVSVKLDASILFPGTIDYKKINIHVANSNDPDAFGIVHNLTII